MSEQPEQSSRHCPDLRPKITDGIGNFSPEDFQQMLNWTECLHRWGRAVRDDVLAIEDRLDRIEEYLGLTKSGEPTGEGDPGDPPPQPWKR